MGKESVGSAAEEAARLLDALSEWAGGVTGSGQSSHEEEAAECRWCPVCRVVHAVTHASPEVREHVATAATSLVQALAAILATHPPARGSEAGAQDAYRDTHHDEGEEPR